jgi:hypothetical protein
MDFTLLYNTLAQPYLLKTIARRSTVTIGFNLGMLAYFKFYKKMFKFLILPV